MINVVDSKNDIEKEAMEAADECSDNTAKPQAAPLLKLN